MAVIWLKLPRHAQFCRSDSAARKVCTTSNLDSVSYFFVQPLEVRPTSGEQFKSGAIQFAFLHPLTPTVLSLCTPSFEA